MRRLLVALLAFTVCSAAACNNSSDSSTTPTSPTIPLTSQTFTGTIAVGGASSNTNFVVAQNGEVDITITSMGPPSNIIMGIAIGIPSTTDTSCVAPVSATDPHVQASTTPLVGSLTAGTYCVRLYDLGFMSAPVNYTISVAHP